MCCRVLGLLVPLLLWEPLPLLATQFFEGSDCPPDIGTVNRPCPARHAPRPQPIPVPTTAELAEQLEQDLEPAEPPPTLAPSVRKTVRLLKLRKFVKTWLPFLPIP